MADLSPFWRRRLLVALSSTNVAFAIVTALFIFAWERLNGYSPGVQKFVKYVLVQGHLATENVVAAWYSSMLLLAVGLAAVWALRSDLQSRPSPFRWGWAAVAGAFVLLSMDEIGSWHERIGMVRALSIGGDRAVGWVFVLAIPIALVGLFLLAFAFLHVRRVPAAFRWMTAGVVLFLANPLFEAAEMRLIHGAGADAATWQRTLHDVLLVLEEGVLELFGVVCFLLGVLTYVGESRPSWPITRGHVRALTAVMVIGVFVSAAVVSRLPPGDTGIPSNWYPAAMFLFVALASRRWRWLALGASAFCGAGLYGYFRLFFYGAPLVAAFATVIGGWLLEAVLASTNMADPRPGSARSTHPAATASASSSPGAK